MLSGGDMIVGLYNLPQVEKSKTIRIKRAFVGDKEQILEFVKKNFQRNWVYEVEHALMEPVSKCYCYQQENGTFCQCYVRQWSI